MSRNNLGFVLFMSLLLIAPKIPLKIPGGAERSSVSLGLAGLMIWFLSCPKRPFSFPRIGAWHPLFWIIIFAIYAFVVSLLSGSVVSIAYACQFLAYAVIGTILMRRYAKNFMSTNRCNKNSILFGIAIIYSIGMLISVLTGPIYPHQTISTVRGRGGFYIQQGIGFSESQNVAGIVVVFFAAACIYMYRGKTWKKCILLCLLLLALISTLSRSAIISFLLAFAFVCCLDNFGPIIQRGSIKVSVLKDMAFVILALSLSGTAYILGIYCVNKSLLFAILPFFDVTGKGGLMASHMAGRFNLWWWGLNNWASGTLLKMIFGGGFRGSMTISTGGAWRTAHNAYITILGDFGVVGLTLFLAALFGAFFHYARLFLTDKAGRAERFGLMAVLALSIHSMTGPYFYSPICLSLLIFSFGATLSAHNFFGMHVDDVSSRDRFEKESKFLEDNPYVRSD